MKNHQLGWWVSFFKSREKIEKPFRKRKKQGSRGIVQGKIAFLK